MSRYLLVKSIVSTQHEEYLTNGIVFADEQKVIDYISDVFVDDNETKKLVDILNQNNVSVIHFRDVVYDYVVALNS